MKRIVDNILEKIKRIGIKRIIIILIIIVVIFTMIVVMYNYIQDKKVKEEIENNNYTSINDFKSVKEIVLYMECKYIKEEYIQNENYSEEIYLEFKYNLYNENNSNKIFFENLSLYIAKVLGYSNFKMIDESKNITIEIICDKEEQKVNKMIINGNENYFAEEDTKRQLNKYTEIKYSENIIINSNILKSLISNKWDALKANFGIKESTFDKYDIYFDEGLEVKIIGKKVFNIIFTEKYIENIINDIKVGESFEKIEKTLGKPTFEVQNLIGYKTKDIYIFFSEKEVSVYRVDSEKDEQFVQLINNFSEIKTIGEITNNLTDIWGDFDEYYVSGNQVNITYSLKGVKLQFNTSNQNGFILYNNYTGDITSEKTMKDITQQQLPKNIYINTEEDLVFIKENNRVMINNEMEYATFVQREKDKENKYYKQNSKVDYYIDGINKIVKFIVKDNLYPKFELQVDINTYLWIDDYRFLYSVKNKGIYILELRNRTITTIIEDKKEFTFKEYNSGILKYDESEIKIN